MKESKIKYNPALTVKENAKLNGVSLAAVRWHIKENHLDRRFERTQNLIADCREYLRKHPKATKTELHKKTGKYRKTSVSDNNRAKCSVEEHRAIYDAIVKRDKVLAEKLAIEHVKNARDSILEKNRRGLWD